MKGIERLVRVFINQVGKEPLLQKARGGQIQEKEAYTYFFLTNNLGGRLIEGDGEGSLMEHLFLPV